MRPDLSSTLPRRQLDETAGQALRQMNPFPHGNPGGICGTCATETARVLTKGKDARQIVAVNDSENSFDEKFSKSEYHYKDEQTAEKAFAPDMNNRAAAVWDWLTNHLVRGGVCVARGGGHVWNFARDYDGHLYLIDMSMRLIKPVAAVSECTSQYANYQNPTTRTLSIVFNYCDPVDLGTGERKKMAVFPCRGSLNTRWRD